MSKRTHKSEHVLKYKGKEHSVVIEDDLDTGTTTLAIPGLGLSQEELTEFAQYAAEAMHAENFRAISRNDDGSVRVSGRKIQDGPQDSVTSFLHCMHRTQEAARETPAGAKRDDTVKLWTRLRGARVFDVPPETWGDLYVAADRYVHEEILEVPYSTEAREYPAEDVDQMVSDWLAMRELGSEISYPDRLPFDNTFLAYRRGVTSDLLRYLYKSKAARHLELPTWDEAFIVGHLVSSVGACDQFVALVDRGRPVALVMDRLADDRRWTDAASDLLVPWYLPMLIELINSHKTCIVEHPRTFGFKERYRAEAKRLRLAARIPPPFYEVRLQQHLIQARTSERVGTDPLRELTYRHDRRAHERCYVRRGPLPLDLKKAERYRRDGFKVFTSNQVDLATHKRLSERGMRRKGNDEWLAIKSRWFDQTVVGDPSLPYIPSVRKIGDDK